MGLYDTFETDSNMEKDGVWIDYGDFRIRIAHSGGANKRYLSYAENKLKPLRRAIESGALSNERSAPIMMDIYAETIILDWETKVEDSWVQGIEDRDGGLQEFNKENVVKTLKALPKLFSDIQEMSGSIQNFRMQDLESEAKN